jgi:hypothetical protein
MELENGERTDHKRRTTMNKTYELYYISRQARAGAGGVAPDMLVETADACCLALAGNPA